jgi:ribosomal protein S18 acetylase RimI-like enzyme
MKSETIFRKFNENDRGELEKMIRALYSEDDYGQPMSVEKIDKTIAELQHNPEKGNITIFENEHGVVGYAITIFFWSNELGGNVAEIDELYVKSEWRNKGIGIKFLDYSANRKTFKIVGLQLEVTPTSERALDYYNRYGFKESKNKQLYKGLV